MSKHDHCCSHDHSDQKNDSQTVSTAHQHQLKQTTTTTFSVSGMDCADEIQAIQKSLSHPLIGSITANLMTSQVIVTHDPDLSVSTLIQKINASGVKVIEPEKKPLNFWVEHQKRIILIFLSASFLVLGFSFEWLNLSSNLPIISYCLSTLFGLIIVSPKAWRSVKQKSLDMNVLMLLAVIGAFYIKDYAEAATVVCLFSLAELLEAYSVSKARKAIKDIISLNSKMATIENNGTIENISVEDIDLHHIVVVYAGAQIPVDGLVLDGSSTVNQAALTGESTAVEKNKGDSVLAGTINENGTLKIKVLKRYSESKIAQVIRLIEDAQSKKAPSQLFVDRFAKIYTPVVTVIALCTAILPPILFHYDQTVWLYKALVFLVIACPCALVIATPIAIVSSLTALARIGVLIKGGSHLEELGRLKALALDKTGTLTYGQPHVVSEIILNPEHKNLFYDVVFSIESQSTHPLAKAAVSYLENKQLTLKNVENLTVIPGKGLHADIDKIRYFIGSPSLFNDNLLLQTEINKHIEPLIQSAYSILIVGLNNPQTNQKTLLGFLGFSDTCRKQAFQFVKDIQSKTNIHDRIYILSGDQQSAVNKIAEETGIKQAIGHLLPEDKVNAIKNLMKKYESVGMVGDGINDAPALATASVGIAMGVAGSDAAIETADVALMTDDLNQLRRTICHAQLSLRTVKANIAFALVTKFVFLILGLFGYSSLWLAVAADMGATLLVIAHSTRLLKVAP